MLAACSTTTAPGSRSAATSPTRSRRTAMWTGPCPGGSATSGDVGRRRPHSQGDSLGRRVLLRGALEDLVARGLPSRCETGAAGALQLRHFAPAQATFVLLSLIHISEPTRLGM